MSDFREMGDAFKIFENMKFDSPDQMAAVLLKSACKMDGKDFEWYPYQWDVLLDRSRFIIVNKARQVGMSRTFAGKALAFGMMFERFRTLFVSSGEDSAKRILSYAYDFLNSMPDRPESLPTENKGEIYLPNQSSLISLPNNPKTVRGFPANMIIVDEFAHFTNDESMMSAISPSISRGGRLIILSNPAGMSNKFAGIWHNDKTYSRHEIPWWLCPDENYRKGVERLKETMDPIEFQQEYCCKFLVKDLQVFSSDEVMSRVDDGLTEHSEPLSGERYRFGIDFGRRIASTVVMIVGLRGDDIFLRRALELKKMDYTVQVERICELDKKFKPEVLNVDATGVGWAPFDMLKNKLGGRVQGHQFSHPFKSQMIGDLRILFQGRFAMPRVKVLISQLLGLERQFMPNSDMFRYRHAQGELDDYVWALGLAVINLRQNVRKPLIYKFVGEREMTKEVRSKINSRARVRFGGTQRVFY